MQPTCYLPPGHTKTPCGKNPAHVPHTDDPGQATCNACYKALTDGYARLRLQEQDTVPRGGRYLDLFNLKTVN